MKRKKEGRGQRQSRGQNTSLNPILVVFMSFLGVFLMFSPNIQAMTVELVYNTDFCSYDSKLDKDYCNTVYKLCDYGVFNPAKSSFLYKKPNEDYKDSLSDLSNVNTRITNSGLCKIINITAYKNPFIDVDNVFCYDDRCWYKYVWWNTTFRQKFPVNASTTTGIISQWVLLNDSTVDINNFDQIIWCNYTVNTTRSIVGYLYFTNESFYRCVDPTETFSVSMDVDEGNESNFGVAPNDLEAWFHLGDLLDSSNYGNDATNFRATNVVTKIGSGYDFDDSDTQCITYPDLDLFTGLLNWTVMGWFNADEVETTVDNNVVFSPYAESKGFFGFTSTFGDGYVHYMSEHVGDGWNYRGGLAGLSAGTWYHFAVVYNEQDGYTVYIDGVDTGDGEATAGAFATDTRNNTIGCSAGTGSFFDGKVDEIQVWNITLTSDEILANYNNTVGNDNFAPLGDVQNFTTNTSLVGVDFNISDFSFASSDFVTDIFAEFNTSEATVNFSLLSSMNIEKLSLGGSNVITVRVLIDDIELLTEDLRTVSSIGDAGSVGTRPISFAVTTGQHNLTYQFKRTGVGSILVSNIDINLLKFVSDEGNLIRSQIINVLYNHSSTDFTPSFNWTMNKTINSSTFITAKQTVTKSTPGGSVLTYFFENLLDNDVSPFWQGFLSTSGIFRSLSGIYIDPAEIGTHDHTINSRQSDSGDVVEVNGSLLDFDLSDSLDTPISFFQRSNLGTNTTETITLGSGIHNIANATMTIVDGDAFFLAMGISFVSTTGSQTPNFFINSTVAESDCFSRKERSLANNDDVGNAFIYMICNGLVIDTSYTFNLFVNVSSGETLVIRDESFSGIELTTFDITLGNLAPIPNSITNPLNASRNSGSDTITWLEFTDPNGDLVTYNITLRNLDGTINSTIGSTTSLFVAVNWGAFPDGDYLLNVQGIDPSGLNSNTTITITILTPAVEIPISISFCLDNGNMFFRTVDVETGNFTTNVTINEEILFCPAGCSNTTIINFGSPGCTESDYLIAIIFIIMVMVAVILIRVASK